MGAWKSKQEEPAPTWFHLPCPLSCPGHPSLDRCISLREALRYLGRCISLQGPLLSPTEASCVHGNVCRTQESVGAPVSEGDTCLPRTFFKMPTDWLVFSGGPELVDPAGVPLPQPAQSWVWLVDLERTVALLIGRCLGGMLQGSPVSPEEQDTAYWLKTPLFSDGVEMDIPQLGKQLSSAGGALRRQLERESWEGPPWEREGFSSQVPPPTWSLVP